VLTRLTQKFERAPWASLNFNPLNASNINHATATDQ
jgi:hypothetical protein